MANVKSPHFSKKGPTQGRLGTFRLWPRRNALHGIHVPSACLTFSMIETFRFAMSPLALKYWRRGSFREFAATKELQASIEIFYVD